jgi:hypothetical protein
MTTGWRIVTVVTVTVALSGCSDKEADSLRKGNKQLEERVATLEKRAGDAEYVIQELDVKDGKARTFGTYHGPGAREKCEEEARGWQSITDRPGAAPGRFIYTCRRTH